MSTTVIPDAADLGTEAAVHAGFPNAATTVGEGALSLDRLLIASPHSTYFFRIRGHRWHRLGIFDGDIAIVDRARPPKQGSLVVWLDDYGEFYLAQWPTTTPQLWGVITSVIHQLQN